MAKKKLTDSEVLALRAAYESWNPHDPNSESADELAARFGVSKQTMYTYRDRWIEQDRRQRERNQAAHNHDGESDASQAIVFLTVELAKARTRIAELENELELYRVPNDLN